MSKNERPGAYEIPSYALALMWRRIELRTAAKKKETK